MQIRPLGVVLSLILAGQVLPLALQAQSRTVTVVRRALSAIGIGTTAGADSVTIGFRDSFQAGAGMTVEGGRTIHPREMQLDLSSLAPGRYLLELLVLRNGSPLVSTRKEFTIGR